MANVLMLLSNPYRPDPRVRREALALAHNGYDVTVAAWDRKGGGKREEKIEGVHIARFGPHNDPKGAAAMFLALGRFWKEVKEWSVKEEWDIIHAHDLDTLPLGLELGKKLGIPVIYDAHEMYAEMVKEDVPDLIYRMLKRAEKKRARKASMVITVNDAIADVIKGWGVSKVGVVMNCPMPVESGKEGEDAKTDNGPSVLQSAEFSALYVGVLEPFRKLEGWGEGITMGKAPGVELFVGGFGSLEERLEKICGENVTLLGPVPPRDVSALSHQADVLIALYDPSYLNNRLGAPNKLFEAMLYGKPLLVAKGSWAGEVVEKEEIGLAVEFEGGGVFQALTRLRKDEELCARMSARGLEAARDRYNWPMMEKRLLDIYRSLLKEGKKGM